MTFRHSVPVFPYPSGRALLFIAGVLVPVAGLTALAFAQDSKPDAKPDKPVTAGAKFKNIKVLKDLPADQLIPVMHSYNVALNVKCSFCHVIGPNHTGFEKDDKPEKTKARQMISMTLDLNKRYKTVQNRVGCYTCHQGHPEPPGVPEETAPPPPKPGP